MVVFERVARLLFLLLWVTGLVAQETVSTAPYTSPGAFVVDRLGKHIYVADETGSRILYVDRERRAVSRSIALSESPTGIALNEAQTHLFVTSRGSEGDVFVVEIERGIVESTLKAGHTTMAPVLNNDESILFVCNRFDDSLSVIDLVKKVEIKRLKLVREPVAAALTADGKLLVVVNSKTYDRSDAPSVGCQVSLIDALQNELISHIRMPNGSIGMRDVCVSADGRHAFVGHRLARNQVPATQLEAGWLTANAVSIVDLEKRELHGSVILDDVARGAADPWGIVSDGQTLCVALAGVHEVALVDLPQVLERVGAGQKEGRRNDDGGLYANSVGPNYVQGVYTDFSFLEGLKQRLRLRGKGPRHLFLRDGTLFVGLYFSGTLEEVRIGEAPRMSPPIALDRQPPLSDVRRGELLFHDASICFQEWQSCSSCHPDGRADGLNWDLTNDGIGNFKNAKSLLFAHRTPPSTAAGVFASLEECVRFELKSILFADRPDEDAEAIVSYLKSLRPIRSPYLESGRLSRAASRGKEVFVKAGCVRCHEGDYYTAQERKNVGTAVAGDHRTRFDIPGLREVWRTAPYFHHGRAATVRDAITTFNPDDRHGETSTLTEQEIADLVEFVLSL